MQQGCPECGNSFEATGDEPSIRCPRCGATVTLRERTVVSHSDPPDAPLDGKDEIDPRAATVSAVESDADTATIGYEAGSGGPDVGEAFGEYELLGEIARGGMGVVFRARQTRLNREVALKMILSSRLATDDDVSRFQVEAEAAARLDHPGIVPIHEVGEIDGQHFFSMGLVEGGSLRDVVESGPLSGRRAAEIVREIAEAVHYAHTRNIVHRDLKPANVLIDGDGRPKVTDFGLAKDIEADSGLTASGQIMGTPGYMPPEQASGRMDEVGPLADVYSLGGILFFLLTRRPPFKGKSTLDTLKLVIDAEPPSPRRHNPAVDADLETICLKCLEKDPSKRYASAAELAEELTRYVEGRPIEARPVGQFERFRRWCLRNPVVAGLAATAVVLLVAGICVSGYFAVLFRAEAEVARTNQGRAEERRLEAEREGRRADRERDNALRAKELADTRREEAEQARRIADEQRERAEEERRAADAARMTAETARMTAETERQNAVRAQQEANRQKRAAVVALAQSRVSLAEAYYRDRDTLSMNAELDRVRGDLRNGDWRYLKRRADPSLVTKQLNDTPLSASLRFSAAIPGSGRFVVNGDGGTHVMDGRTGKVVATLPVRDGKHPSYYPNAVNAAGTLFAGVNRTTSSVEVFDLRTNELVANWKSGRPPIYFDAEDRLYLAQGDRTERRDVMSGEVLETRAGFQLLAVAPTTGLLLGSSGGMLQALESLDGEPAWTAPDVSAGMQMAVSPDGRFAFLLAQGKDVRVYDLSPEGPAVREAVRRIPMPLVGQFARIYSTAHGSAFMAVGMNGVNVEGLVWDRRTGRPLPSVMGLHRITQEPAFDSETGLLAAPYGVGVKFWSVGVDQESSVHPAGVPDFAFAGEDHLWRTTEDQPGLALVSRRDGSVVHRPAGTNRAIAVASRANVAVLSPRSAGGLMVVRGAPDAIETVRIPYTRVEEDLAISPDGRYVAVLDYKSRLAVFDVRARKVALGTTFGVGGKSGGNYVAFIDDNRLVGLRMRRKNIDCDMIVCSPTGQDVVKKVLPFPVRCVDVAADGSVVAFGSDRYVHLYDTSSLEEVDRLRVHDEEVTALRFHPTRPVLATGSTDKTVRVFDWKSGTQLAEFLGPVMPITSIDFSPNGRELGVVDTELRIWPLNGILGEGDTAPPAGP